LVTSVTRRTDCRHLPCGWAGSTGSGGSFFWCARPPITSRLKARFSEGFETPTLTEARVLLAEFSW